MSDRVKELLQQAIELIEEQELHIAAEMLPAGRVLVEDIKAALSHQAEPCEFHDSDQAACQQYSGQVPCEPAPEQDEREAVETVPRWKFHALVEHCKKQDQLISDLYARLNSVRLYDAKEVWFWQGDGCDHLESLACPVVIEADELRRLVNAAPIAQTTQGDDQ